MTPFAGVAPVLAGALAGRGYTELTPVQIAVLAPEADNTDLLVSAQTGSGKTVAFGLAMAPTLLGDQERFSAAAEPLAIVVAPTRELALQVRRELDWLYEPTGVKTASCVGGMDMRQERRMLGFGAHIVVGTPGRLCDHIRRGSLNLASIRVAVLDEADEMLDLGFREDLEFILGSAPAERRTLMFSATVPKPIAMLAKRFQKGAVRISTAQENEQHSDIEYRAMSVASSERENAVINTLRYFEAGSAMVFCATRDGVKHLAARLSNRGFDVVALSGELSQSDRTLALQSMRDGRARVCVATDVASRGIDLPNLDLVIHADLPMNGDTLLHRSGRTGRAGRNGVCVVIASHARRRVMERMLRMAGVNPTFMAPPSAESILKLDRERLLSGPVLTGELTEEELAFARDLLATHSPEQIAAAILRQDQGRRPSPEEFSNEAPMTSSYNSEPREPRGPRSGFEAGVWFKLSVGRKQRAEPRWLLPLICRAGGVEKRHVGSIKILETESRFEISSSCADKFMETVAAGVVEKSILITRMEGHVEETTHRAKVPYDRDRVATHERVATHDRKPRAKPFGKPGAPRGKHPKAASAKAVVGKRKHDPA